MPETIYALTHRHMVFDGTNMEEVLDFVRNAGYPGAYVTASANYPGASATFTMYQDIPDNGGYASHFTVGCSWGLPNNGFYPATSLADPNYGVALVQFIQDNAPGA